MNVPIATKRQLEAASADALKQLWRDSVVALLAVGNPSELAIEQADIVTRSYAALAEQLVDTVDAEDAESEETRG